jgi:hypothetical protein
MISLLSQMSGLYEAPEDIFNAQDHCLRPERAYASLSLIPASIRPHFSLTIGVSRWAPYRISRARGMAKYMASTASAPTMLIEAAAHCAPTNDENAPMNIPPTNNTTWVI